jgi:glycosyltransferase involved in cell wall biosynthesis
LYSAGIDLNASSDILIMVGRTITVRIKDAASILKPVPPKYTLIIGTSTISPKNPYTTEGIPARVSITGFKILLIVRGASSARNIGLIESKGQYICFCDSDNTVGEKWLETFRVDSDETDLVIQGFSVTFDGRRNGKEVETGIQDQIGNSEENVKNLIVDLHQKGILGFLWCKRFKKSIIEEHKLRFNTEYVIREDEDFILRYLKYIKTFSNFWTGYYQYHCPDYSLKYYLLNEKCLRKMWSTVKSLLRNDSRISKLAPTYTQHYFDEICKTYRSGIDSKSRIHLLNYFIEEYYVYRTNLKGLLSKVFILFLFPKAPKLSDLIYSVLFKVI